MFLRGRREASQSLQLGILWSAAVSGATGSSVILKQLFYGAQVSPQLEMSPFQLLGFGGKRGCHRREWGGGVTELGLLFFFLWLCTSYLMFCFLHEWRQCQRKTTIKGKGREMKDNNIFNTFYSSAFNCIFAPKRKNYGWTMRLPRGASID